MIILGKDIQQKRLKKLTQKISKLEHKPVLVIIQIGDNKESTIYINQKIKFGKSVGIPVEFYQLESTVELEFIQKLISDFNNDEDIQGIIVQLPLPKKLQKFQFEIIDSISPEKDVDGFHPVNLGRMMLGMPAFVSATPAGIMELISRYNIETSGKHCVVIGRSNIVGRPVSILLSQKAKPGNCTVTVCHSRTPNIAGPAGRLEAWPPSGTVRRPE